MVIVVSVVLELVTFAGIRLGSARQLIRFPVLKSFFYSALGANTNFNSVLVKEANGFSAQSGTNHDVHAFLSEKISRQATSSLVGAIVRNYFDFFSFAIYDSISRDSAEVFANAFL